MKLLVRPKPEKGESFIGYVVRLTELNGYDTPSWILSLCGIDYMELQWKFTFVFSLSDKLRNLAELTENPITNLTSLLYLPTGSRERYGIEDEYNFNGAFLNRSIIRPHCPKICPKCLKESAYARRVWDCSLVTACPIHECKLIDVCPKCKSRIRCVRNRLSVCSCGCDWRETGTELLSQEELAVSQRVYELWGALPMRHHSLEEESKNPLHRLDLRDFVVVLTFISGLSGKMAWATGRPARSIKLQNNDLHKLYTRSYSVFENWPHNFHQFLRKYSNGESRFNPCDGKLDTALKKEFGPFYEYLYRDLNQSQFDFMRQSFAEFLTNRLKSQCRDVGREPLPESFSETDKYISLAEARRLLKITHRAMSDLIATGQVEFVIRNRGMTLEYVVRLFDVQNVKEKFERALTTRGLAKELGVDCQVIEELAQAGYLQTRWRPAVDGYHTIKFDRDSAQELLNSSLIRNAASQPQ